MKIKIASRFIWSETKFLVDFKEFKLIWQSAHIRNRTGIAIRQVTRRHSSREVSSIETGQQQLGSGLLLWVSSIWFLYGIIAYRRLRMQTQRSCVEGKNGCFLFAIGSHTTERPNNLILVRVLLPAFYNIRCLILLSFTREGYKTATFLIHLNSESMILLAQRTSGNGYLFDN